MERESFLQLLRQHRAIAVIRAPTVEVGLQLANAAEEGGLRLLEITWTSAEPEDLVNKLRHQLPHCTIGVGTALSTADLKAAGAAGAQFCFCPHTDPALIDLAQRMAIPIVPGALTPNEIVTAWQTGAAAVKVFPVGAMGGTSYVRAVGEPLGHIPLVPTGGVTVENAQAMVQAGAIAVGLSTSLFPRPLVAAQNWGAIAQLSADLVHRLSQATTTRE
ncbi:bifunctional 4-hydroxy-2-oxoglutarate aldolase/2-dehydro-3-deoxy-phosphogluconate aldolase [Nodosilinea sp. LEGE 07088]|uniref:bifunctional 4-hydroxy-2-oxoglutarate aldolase/2-dehydro-3-deoxy-phosphogluconate aldolase n=1 Tax=Nodosilinea sp. LEGE 07088 TaxID=2777968 RepID=UPI0018828C69|nr:bifunctional 4-hydroxy-2-oxoglutarate aldolase/2-dehydro-3-deoxy-phosphogluconate aldolase [Nodosilinea sp. LEGE 07088]MBE9139551.1 bifunctional 4-hydroxy-2-oxoglutarate aldolase/2-dehydro-3-deoxy-phosphogluconate aldolase [Nodosilinea sp. LEGE 07088]